MQILLVPWGNGYGHLARCIELGAYANSLGDSSCIAVTSADQARRVEARGVSAIVFPSNYVPNDPWTAWYNADFIHESVEQDRRMIAALGAELIIHDGRLSSPIASHVENIRCAGIVQSVNLPGFIYPGRSNSEALWTEATPAFNDVLGQYGITTTISDVRELFLRETAVVPSIPAFDPMPTEVTHNSPEYVGPITGDSHTEKLNDAPGDPPTKGIFFYRTVNTIQDIDAFTSAFDHIDLPCFIATGDEEATKRLQNQLQGDKFLVRTFWPMGRLKEWCSVAIIHGGHGTCMTCLRAGVPMIVIADGSPERLVNGQHIEEMGAGVAFDTEVPAQWDWSNQGNTEAQVDWPVLAEVIQTVMCSDTFSQTASSWADRMAEFSLPNAYKTLAHNARVPFGTAVTL